MTDIYSLVLSEEEDETTQSTQPLVLNILCQKPVIDYVLSTCTSLSDNMPVVVVGKKRQHIMEHLADRCMFAFNENPGGTAHSALMAKDIFKNRKGTVLIISGNMPLISSSIVKKALDFHIRRKNAATVLSYNGGSLSDTTLTVDDNNKITKISNTSASGGENNAGVYFFDIECLISHLGVAERNRGANLSDIVASLIDEGLPVCAYRLGDESAALKIRSKIDLCTAQKDMQKRINFSHMENGVTIIDPDMAYIGPDVTIGPDTVIHPLVTMEGNTVVGSGCVIYQNTIIRNSKIGDNNNITSSVIIESEIENNINIGPFAYIRPKCHVGSNVKVGDFVELKNAVIGDNTKISHLTYVGDSTVGTGVNFGCGTVTVNYDGQSKFRTSIGDHAFIGCNTNLVSPVNVGNGAYIAAGSTITDDVPANSLAIARQRQVVKKDWNDRRKNK